MTMMQTDEKGGLVLVRLETISAAPLAGHPLTVNLGEGQQLGNNLVGNPQQPYQSMSNVNLKLSFGIQCQVKFKQGIKISFLFLMIDFCHKACTKPDISNKATTLKD